MLFLNRFCDDFRKFLRQVGVFDEGNENVLEATRAGERRTPPFSIMLSSEIQSISIDLFIFCSSFCKKSRVFFPDFVWFNDFNELLKNSYGSDHFRPRTWG